MAAHKSARKRHLARYGREHSHRRPAASNWTTQRPPTIDRWMTLRAALIWGDRPIRIEPTSTSRDIGCPTALRSTWNSYSSTLAGNQFIFLFFFIFTWTTTSQGFSIDTYLAPPTPKLGALFELFSNLFDRHTSSRGDKSKVFPLHRSFVTWLFDGNAHQSIALSMLGSTPFGSVFMWMQVKAAIQSEKWCGSATLTAIFRRFLI